MVRMMFGDVRELLTSLRTGSIHCVMTSPPYYGLRNYKHPKQIGLESTPDQYVAALVGVFREVRRVLRDDGTVWINIGDSYSRVQPGRGDREFSRIPSDVERLGSSDGYLGRAERPGIRLSAPGVSDKNLLGIPWMLAFALRADGWTIRDEIIWAKTNPMPESVKDRCTRSHETIFMLTKNGRYFYDQDAIKEPAIWSGKREPVKKGGFDGKFGAETFRAITSKRTKRYVWTVSTKAYRGAHFAVYPPDLIEPCILAGCPRGGVVLDPFAGSGTTAMVARRHGREAVLIELDPANRDLIEARLNGHRPVAVGTKQRESRNSGFNGFGR
jgi:DNA modification methylase